MGGGEINAKHPCYDGNKNPSVGPVGVGSLNRAATGVGEDTSYVF